MTAWAIRFTNHTSVVGDIDLEFLGPALRTNKRFKMDEFIRAELYGFERSADQPIDWDMTNVQLVAIDEA